LEDAAMNAWKVGLPLSFLLAVGCREEAPPPVSDGPAPAIADEASPASVRFTSGALAESMRVGTISKTFDANDILRVQVPIRDATGYDMTVDYRFTFLDANRNIVDQPASWQAKPLHAGTVDVIDGVAPSPAARDFVLDVRPAR
jgi:hypothetical protein